MTFRIDLFYNTSFPVVNDMKYTYIYDMRHEIRRHNPLPLRHPPPGQKSLFLLLARRKWFGKSQLSPSLYYDVFQCNIGNISNPLFWIRNTPRHIQIVHYTLHVKKIRRKNFFGSQDWRAHFDLLLCSSLLIMQVCVDLCMLIYRKNGALPLGRCRVKFTRMYPANQF